MTTNSSLRALFEPKSIAVVGASSKKGKTSYFLMQNLLKGGYAGKVYPVNPNAKKIFKYKSYPSVLDIPDEIDLAFLVVTNDVVERVLLDCSKKNVKAVMIVTAGFAEVGEQGAELQKRVAEFLRSHGMRGLGPNSVGMVNASQKLVGSFVPFSRWPEGTIAMASQSGIFAGALVADFAAERTQRIGLSMAVCFGNKVDVDEVDFLEYAAEDPATKVIALHLESFRRPREFLSLANRVKQTKPVVVLKTGRTAEGAKAAASHTGSLAAPDRLVDAALRQYGVVRAESLDDFKGMLRGFAWQPLPRGRRVGVLTFSGALGVMTVDEMKVAGLELAKLSPSTVQTIARLMPKWQGVENPVDGWVALGAGARKIHEEMMEALLADPNVDMVFGILLPIPNSDFPDEREVFDGLMRRHPDKPIFLLLVGDRVKERWLKELDDLHLPNYVDPRTAVRAMQAMCSYAEQRNRMSPDPLSLP